MPMTPKALVVAMTLTTATVPAVAAFESPDLINDQIRRAARSLGLHELSHEVTRGWLWESRAEDVRLRLTRGVTYTILGACDIDCSDLDFTLIDSYGDIVDQDVLTDDLPIVRVTPRFSQTFRVRVDMYACSIEPCEFGVAAFVE